MYVKYEVIGSNPTWANFLYEIKKPQLLNMNNIYRERQRETEIDRQIDITFLYYVIKFVKADFLWSTI